MDLLFPATQDASVCAPEHQSAQPGDSAPTALSALQYVKSLDRQWDAVTAFELVRLQGAARSTLCQLAQCRMSRKLERRSSTAGRF
jgi:hypothetical protein